MGECPHKTDCELFAQFVLEASLHIWKIQFCDNAKRFSECARYDLVREAKAVPANLLPNGKLLPTSTGGGTA